MSAEPARTPIGRPQPGIRTAARDRSRVVTAADKLAARIRDQILSGDLSPGDRLPAESELSSHYQVGRNTAREALRTLSSQGMVVMRRGVRTGGTFVAVPLPEHISDSLRAAISLLADSALVTAESLVEIREMLEVPAAELAAERRTDLQLEAIRDALFDPFDVDPVAVFAINRRFHFAIFRAAQNPLLELVADPIYRVHERQIVPLEQRAPGEFWRHVDRDHRTMLACIETRDAAGAGAAARAHLRDIRVGYEALSADGGAERR